MNRGLTPQHRAQQGVTLTPPRSGKWRHPWTTSPRWDAETQGWVATVRPGFVNGQCPVIGDEPLYVAPLLGLSWRNVGSDGPGSTVPQFFLDRGVLPPPRLSDDLGQAVQQILNSQATQGARLLRACDVVLHQPRLALTSSIEVLPGQITGTSNVSQMLGVRDAAQGDRLKVFATPLFRPVENVSNPATGDFEEANFDEVLIATVFLLSPVDTAPNSAPTAGWRPFVRHNLFWDLNWYQPGLGFVTDDPNLTVLLPLAGGAGQLIVNSITSSINDAFDRARNILAATSLAGTFWTPTGGGSDSVFPLPPIEEEKPAIGTDKTARRQARERAAMLARRRQTLDPAFPYRAQPFDPALLS